MSNKLKGIIIIFVLFLIGIACWFVPADPNAGGPDWEMNLQGVTKVTIDGHVYLKTREGQLTHSESCQCKQSSNN